MGKIKFIEGEYEVCFDATHVIKLDDHRFYTYVSGRNFKGVDFMLVDKNIGLVLIELKDYRDADNIPEKDEILATFLEKCEDSLRLIEIIEAYYLRKRWIRFFWRKWPAVVFGEPKFWLNAASYLQSGRVLLLEDVSLG